MEGLVIAMRNLIENLTVFTHTSIVPKIIIDHIKNKTSIIITVRDNGIGFNMQYANKIFDIFQRLPKSEDFPGTGVGLALMSKAIQRMNGKVCTESNPGSGAIFFLEVTI